MRFVVAACISIAGLLAAILGGVPETALLALPWMVLTLFGLASAENPRVRVSVSSLSERMMVGDTVELRTTVLGTVDGTVRVRPVPSANFAAPSQNDEFEESDPEAKMLVVSAGEPAESSTELVANAWGAHDLGGVEVEHWPRYGLFRSVGFVDEPTIIRVHPRPTQLQELLAPHLVRRISGTHRSAESARGVEYADLREFGAGDSVRDINWRASARSQDLWVSQRHPDRITDVVLLLDSFVESGHDVRRVFGLSVEATIALAESHLGATDRVGLVEFGGVVRWITPGTGRVQLQRLTDAVLSTGLYANAARKELPMLPPRALPPRSFVVALTPLLDARFIDGLFAVRGRGHDVAVIECGSIAAPLPEEPHVNHVGWQLWQAERSLLRDRLAGQGIAVAPWVEGDHLDVVLGELARRRRGAGRVRSR